MQKHFKLFSQNESIQVDSFFNLKSYKIVGSESFLFEANKNKSLIGFANADEITLSTLKIQSRFKGNCYFSVNESIEINIHQGSLIIIEMSEYNYPNQLGQINEDIGQLKYIDGCTDSILIYPTKLGNPCLNALYFPPKIEQTKHFHPSLRFGLVLSGKGFCDTGSELVPLITGNFFYIPEQTEHRFITKDSNLTVIAFHPDSDWGPLDENHPMINRTWFKDE